MSNIFPEKLAIIGNAPTEIGSNNGELIDSFDKVMRFNNYVIGDKFEKDYGARVDFWCRCLTLPDTQHNIYNYDNVFCPAYVVLCNKLPRNIVMFLPKEYRDDLFNKALEYFPEWNPLTLSMGIRMLFWIYREQDNYLNPDNVFGFGFFNKKIKHHYFNKSRVSGNYHDGEKEKKLFEYMISGEV